MKKISLCFLTIFLLNISLFSQVKKYIPIVKPVLYEKTKESFESVAKKFEQEGHKELAEIFRSFAMGGHGSGFVFVDTDGENYIITNKHVVSNSQYVNLEFMDKGSSKIVYESCPIIYTDDEIDLAVLKFPNNEKIFEKSFAINTDKQVDGKEIWSAGFPGLFGKPMWQFAKGNITNEEAYVEQLVSPDISYLIQHSASIDPGNSGGPILVQDEKRQEGYSVIGVNTWSIANRQNTFFAIPSKNIAVILQKAKETISEAIRSDSLKSELIKQCRIFTAEINSEKPKWQQVNNFVSYAFVAEKGWDSFIKVLSMGNEETIKRLQASFFEYSPVEAMRHSILYRIWYKLYFSNTDKNIEFKEINLADEEQIGKVKTVRTNFIVNGASQEIEWIFEHGHWRISNYNLERQSEKSDSPKKEENYYRNKKKYEGSPVYFGADVLFTPYTLNVNRTLRDNFDLMGVGGAITLNFKGRTAIFARVNSVSLNNKMKNRPESLTHASVKYLHINHGICFYFGPGKFRPYMLIGVNYMDFYEKGEYETTSLTNHFVRTGIQFGVGAKYKFNKLGVFAEGSFNGDTELLGFLMEDALPEPNLSIFHVSVGLSIDLKKK